MLQTVAASVPASGGAAVALDRGPAWLALLERCIEFGATLATLALLLSTPQNAVAQVPVLPLAVVALTLLLVPGAAVLSWWAPSPAEGFCGAVARAFIVSFLVLAAGTVVCLTTGLSMATFAMVGLLLLFAGLVAATVCHRAAYFARALTASWYSQTPAERVISLVLALAILAVGVTILLGNYPTGFQPEEVIPARRMAALAQLAPDRVMHRLGDAPTYLYPALTFVLGLISRTSVLDVLYVITNLLGVLLPLAACALIAFITSVVRDIRVGWVAATVLTIIAVVDPQALTHEIGIFLHYSNRLGVTPAILIPALLYLLIRSVATPDRGALILVPLGVLAIALVHARDAVFILIVMGGFAVALAVGTAVERRQVYRLGLMFVVSAVFLLAYQSLQDRLVGHVADVTHGLRSEFLTYLGTLLADPRQALWGTVPESVPSLVGLWRFENYQYMVTTMFPYVTRMWLPLGVLVASALLGPWAPWTMRACAWTMVGALLMVRIPVAYTAVSAVVGDPDIGQIIGVLAILGLPFATALPVMLFDILSSAPRRVLGGAALLLPVVVAVAWLAFPVIQTGWIEAQALAKQAPDLFVVGSLTVALAAPLVVTLSRLARLRDPIHRRRALIGATALAVPLVALVVLFQVTLSRATGFAPAAYLSLIGCVALGLALARWRPGTQAPNELSRRPLVPTLAFVPVLVAAGLTLPLVSTPDPLILARRGVSLQSMLWDEPKVGSIRADPEFFYRDVLTIMHAELSPDVLTFLRQGLPPQRIFYSSRDLISVIPIVSDHYVVYYGGQKLSTDLDYYSGFSPSDKDLLFDVPPGGQSTGDFLRLLHQFGVTHILVGPKYQQSVSDWLATVNRNGPLLVPVFDRDGYAIYEVHPEFLGQGATG